MRKQKKTEKKIKKKKGEEWLPLGQYIVWYELRGPTALNSLAIIEHRRASN